MIKNINHIKHTDSGNFFLLAGPCVVESKEVMYEVAERVATITDKLQIPFIFKASYKKANRSRVDSYTGIGDVEGLELLYETGSKFGLPTVTDVHSEREAELAANFCEVLQIPAFLCRQTELLLAAARTSKVVNIKKGQFLSPEAMQFAVEKVRSVGNPNVMITERGTTFGYQDLVVDYRGIPTMQKFGAPVILDVTHALQQPNQSSGVTGGRPDLIETIARAGIATGVDGIFIETHPNPGKALSDGANMLPLDQLEQLLTGLVKIRKAIAE